jgi:Ca-activated chloride channel homolog
VERIGKGLLRTLLFVGLSVSAAGQVPAQGTAPGTGSASREIARPVTNILVHSDLVLIPVTVTDGKGRIVTGLQKEQFTLFEDKVPQTITQFDTEDAPVSVGLIFDASDSMQPRLYQARAAVNELLDNANPADEFFLVRFSTRAALTVPLTTDRERVRQSVESMETGGSTALLDAVLLGIDELKSARHTRKALIIISDGEDNASHIAESRFRELVRESDVLIYAIGISDSSGFVQNFPNPKLTGSALLNDIATQTGGRLFQVGKLKQLPKVATTIGSWLRSEYVLGYASSNEERDGKYRKVQVKLTRPKGFPRMHAAWRLGYYAPTE